MRNDKWELTSSAPRNSQVPKVRRAARGPHMIDFPAVNQRHCPNARGETTSWNLHQIKPMTGIAGEIWKLFAFRCFFLPGVPAKCILLTMPFRFYEDYRVNADAESNYCTSQIRNPAFKHYKRYHHHHHYYYYIFNSNFLVNYSLAQWWTLTIDTSLKPAPRSLVQVYAFII